MQNKNYFLFDLDGTLTDPKEGITKSVAYALKRFGINVENLDGLTKFIGPPLADAVRDFYGFTEEQARDAVKFYRETYSVTGIFENIIYPGISDLLRQLTARGKTVALATSKPIPFAVKILQHFEIEKYFTFVAGSELDGRRDGKAEVIKYALENLGVTDLSTAVMIGDRMYDIVGARKNGVESIGVLYGYGSRAELTDAGADLIAENVSELGKTICNL